MNILIPIVAVAVGFVMLTKQNASADEAPKDANTLLALVLSPSMVNLDQLVDFYNRFAASAANATTPQANLRLNMYALVTALKIAMLRKGAQPDSAELVRLAYAPSSGMGGIQQLPDAPADVQNAAYAALASNDPSTIAAYLAKFATAANTATGTLKGRLMTYALALKAKQLMTSSGINFPDNRAYYAIANSARTTSLPANSIMNG